MAKRALVIACAIILTAGSFSCKSKAQVKGIELSISFAEDPLSDHLITNMQYRWKTDREFMRMAQDMNIYVHFWHRNNLLIQDDHMPEVLTSKWQPENEYTYTRRIYIPSFIDEFDPTFKGEETLKLAVGFYSPYDRSGESKKQILEQKVKVFPPPIDTPEVIYEEGWHDLEIDPEAFLKQWRWMAQEARCIIDNPHRDALLVIKGGVNIGVLEQQKIIFKINDLILDDFIAEESYFEKSYNIKKEMLGEEDEFFLTILTDKTFVPNKAIPGSTDKRELGVQISFIYFR